MLFQTTKKVLVFSVLIPFLHGQGVYNCPNYQGIPQTPVYSIGHYAYIPYDHVAGPNPCVALDGSGRVSSMTYKGDSFFPGQYYVRPNTWRASTSVYLIPESQYSSQRTSVYPTRNYGYGSPVNGISLTPPDDDPYPYDCYLWNNQGVASTAGMNAAGYATGAHTGTAHMYGQAGNPLEPDIGPIRWDVNVSVDSTNPAYPTMKATGTVTCFPAHEILVNNVQLFSYLPTRSDPAYVAGCLVMGFSNQFQVHVATSVLRAPCM